MLVTPSAIGARAEREVAYALMRCGWDVYLAHLAPAGNGQVKGTRLAADYELRPPG